MKYISYSLWGDNKVYTYGIVENALDAVKFYKVDFKGSLQRHCSPKYHRLAQKTR